MERVGAAEKRGQQQPALVTGVSICNFALVKQVTQVPPELVGVLWSCALQYGDRQRLAVKGGCLVASMQALQRLPDPCHSVPRQSLPRILETTRPVVRSSRYTCVCGVGRVRHVREGAAYKTCIASSKEGLEGNCTFEVSSRVLVFLEVH